jgi:hypothetical protein
VATEQHAPVANTSTPIFELALHDLAGLDGVDERVVQLVAGDIRDRAEIGRARYGVYLQAHNGRDVLRDAYEEALDLAMYLRQAISEQVAVVTLYMDALHLLCRLRARLRTLRGEQR